MTAEDTRTRLLQTALDLIWQSNYNFVGVNDICKQAGVTKGGFYHHFDSKAALFCAATEYYSGLSRTALDQIMSPLNSPVEQLVHLLVFIFDNKLGDYPQSVRGCAFFSAQPGCEEDMVNGALQKMSQNGQKYSRAIVRSLADGNFLEPDADIERTARTLSQYIHGLSAFIRVERGLTNQQLRDDITEAYLRLLGLKREHWDEVRVKLKEFSKTKFEH